MNKTIKIIVTSFLFLNIFFSYSYSWSKEQHIVIGELAYGQLHEQTKKIVDSYLLQISKIFGDSYKQLGMVSLILDHLRSQKFNFFNPSHYINIPYTRDNTSIPLTIATPNAISSIENAIRNLKYQKSNPTLHIISFIILIHLIEDIHAPQHNISLYSKTFPNGDRGANDFKVKYKRKRNPIDLHYLWDSVFFSYKDMHIRDSKDIQKKIQSLTQQYHFTQKTIKQGVHAWSSDAHQLAIKYLYNNIEPGDKLTQEYINKATDVANRQITLAGYRLAEVLNRVLKNTPPINTKKFFDYIIDWFYY